MWERKYEHGRWNGHKLNILSTAIDGGKRLHISEIPYSNLPNIKSMGSKAKSINLEVVFVGSASLTDANAFIDSLDKEPSGELEHPWLGELKLTFETYSQSISTKRGLVSLSLTFFRTGVSPTITISTIVSAKEQSAIVENVSVKSFTKEVKELEVEDVSKVHETQSYFTNALNTVVDIVNRLEMADDLIKEINHSINEAHSAISSLANEPQRFANMFINVVDAVANALKYLSDSPSEAVDNSRNAQNLMLNQIDSKSPTSHFNVQMVTAAVKMSKDLHDIEKTEKFDVTKNTKQSDIIISDISRLIDNVDKRIADATKVSTLESMELYDELTVLKGSLQIQRDKVISGSAPHRMIHAPRFRPALALAHDEYTKESLITAINALQHPLFMKGDIAVRDEE